MKKIFLYGAIILSFLGIFLRFSNIPQNTEFDWDQENLLAIPARDIIVNHHFPLIGAKASSAVLFVGPLYSYLAAAVYALMNLDPAAGAVLAGILASITLIAGFIISRKIFGGKTSYFFLLLWSLSTFVIMLDRIPWNLNLLALSALFIYFGLWSLIQNGGKRGWWPVGLGLFLGLNSHYTIIFFLPVIAYVLLRNGILLNRKLGILSAFILLALLPLVLFELRHDFLMSRNLAGFLQHHGNFGIGIFIFLQKLVPVVLVLADTSARLIIENGPEWVHYAVFACLLIFLFTFRRDKKVELYLKLFVPTVVIYLLGFLYYSVL